MGFQNITGWMGFQKKDQLNVLYLTYIVTFSWFSFVDGKVDVSQFQR